MFIVQVNVLLQAYISQLKLDGFALVSDMVYVSQVFKFVYTCMCVYVYVHIHVNIHVCVYMYMYIYMLIYVQFHFKHRTQCT